MRGRTSAPALQGDWALAALPPGRASSPLELEDAQPEWTSCPGPLTVAAALRAAGKWNASDSRDFDAEDWWFRCRFTTPNEAAATLRFDGLATVADAWLNGVHLLHSENMFVRHEAPAVGLRSGANELLLRFHALTPLLAPRKPRPRWKTRLVTHQSLRWYRTTLLGRIPEWCPPIAPVGPWRTVRLVPDTERLVRETELAPVLEGADGVLSAVIRFGSAGHAAPTKALLEVGGEQGVLSVEPDPSGGWVLRGITRVPNVGRWWPHTHGDQPLYDVTLALVAGGEHRSVALGRVGFRTLAQDRGADGQGFGLVINDEPVFCRGVCWTPMDLVRLSASPEEYRAALQQVRDAGQNTIRIGGTMTYEDDAFYDACDQMGILVWQDFMFANMDYPSDDPAFVASVATEARQFLLGMQGRPSLVVLCGGSETEQQAAMLGLPEASWSGPVFNDTLPSACARFARDVLWIRSSPSGGTLPFHPDRGVSHYYGVGAYRRPLEDARRANVRFAAECLGFSHVPEPNGSSPGSDAWRSGIPRDPGADWDFETVRDYYLRELFGVDPAAFLSRDLARYLAMGRVATGMVIERTIGEWRRPGSTCRGSILWFLRDFRPGAGWGLVDSDGKPKPAYWHLARASRSLSLIASDEGLNGLVLHAVNDAAESVRATLRVTVYREGRVPIASAEHPVRVPARGAATISADGLFEGFLDLTYAYRFGQPGHDVIAAALVDSRADSPLATAFHWPAGPPSEQVGDLGLRARATPFEQGYCLSLEADRVAVAVAIRAPGFLPDDNYLHLEPGQPRLLQLRPEGPEKIELAGTVEALNGLGPVPIEVRRA